MVFLLLHILVIEIVTCIQTVFLDLRNQRMLMNQLIQNQFWNIILVHHQLLLKHSLHVGKKLKDFFKFNLTTLKLYRAGIPK